MFKYMCDILYVYVIIHLCMYVYIYICFSFIKICLRKRFVQAIEKEWTIYLLQQYSVHLGQVSDISKDKSTYTGSNTDAHNRQLFIRAFKHRLDKFPDVNIWDEISERNVLIDQATRVT